MKFLVFVVFLVVFGVSAKGFGLKSLIETEIFSLNGSNLTLSNCESDIQKLVASLDGSILSWGWKMLDASSKIQPGLEILSDDLGQFDECIGAENENGKIFGKYCLGKLGYNNPSQELRNFLEKQVRMIDNAHALTGRKIESSSFRESINWAACLPNSCSAEDFNILYDKILNLINRDISITFTENLCSTKNDDTEISTGAIIAIFFFASIVCIMVIETCYDLYCQHFTKEPVKFFLAFSIYTNSSKLFKMSKSGSQLDCLNGLRCYSLFWVVIGHTYSLGIQAPLSNRGDVLQWADRLQSMLIVSGTLSVDTFFVVGGTLVSYVYMQSMQKSKKFNIFIYYLHRYIRLTPALGALILTIALLFPYLGNGPYWSNVRINQELCQESWWSTLLYIQNYVSVPKLCVGHSWYLSVDMQLYLLSPIILYSLRKWAKPTIIALLSIIVALAVYNFITAWNNHYTAILSNIYSDNADYFSNFYVKTHVRAGAWILGVIMGFIISEIKERRLTFRPHKVLNLAAWIACIAVMLTCIYIGHGFLRTPDYNEWGNSLHIALVRQVWVAGVSWIILSCTFGYGGPVNWFLSLPVYQVFNRFSYSIYLIHYMFITWWYSSAKSPIHFTDMMMGMYFWGIICFSCLISFFWVLAFESPFIILEKILFEFLMRPKRNNTTP